MVKNETQQEFDEYHTLFSKHHSENSAAFVLTEKQAEEFLGFPVKEISSHIPIKATLEEQRKYIDNRLCKLFIIGSAFPMIEGWKMFTNKETVFIAVGFGNIFQPFKFNYGPNLLELETIEREFDPDMDSSYHVCVEYQQETARAMSSGSVNFGLGADAKFS